MGLLGPGQDVKRYPSSELSKTMFIKQVFQKTKI